MKRRIVLITCLLGIVGGGAGAALASPKTPVQSRGHDICLVLAQNENYNNTQYLCLDTP